MAESSSSQKETRDEQRKNAIDWDTYFMGIAFLARHRSKDPEYQVGACVVNEDKKIIGVGYNGFPTGCADDKFPWLKGSEPSTNKHSYVCHAETNAILFRNTSDVRGCTMYVTLFPCNECAKIIIQSGIKKIYYFSDEKQDDDRFKASKPMFEAAKVDYKQFVPKLRQVVIEFSTENLANVKHVLRKNNFDIHT